MANELYIGFSKTVELPKGGFLFIDDEVPDIPRARMFDPTQHCFTPLKDVDHRKARELAELLYTLSPQGENTLTVRNGKRAMAPALLNAGRLDQVEGDEEVRGMVDDLLFSPLLSKVFTTAGKEFSFNPRSVILARINRAELGEHDALVLGLFLLSHYRGQCVVPDLGFYGRDIHTRLIREERLIAGVNYMDELPEKLRNMALLIEDKAAKGATYEDAVTLARYEGLRPDPSRDDNPYNRFIAGAVG